MKKIRRLSLHKETLRLLEPAVVAGAAGPGFQAGNGIPRSYVDGCPSTPSGCETLTLTIPL